MQKWLHDHPRIGAILPEAAMIIIVGMATGLLHLVSGFYFNEGEEDLDDMVVHSILAFSPTTFFVVLLPPIIFNSGYHVRRDLFFRYITPICLYACVGTTICAAAVAGILYSLKFLFTFDVTLLELMAFGALISATDPVSTLSVFSAKKVDPHLFYLVFGESVINDAVGLVLYMALAHLVQNSLGEQLAIGEEIMQFLWDFVTGFIFSLCLGTLFGVIVAFFLKKVDLRSTPLFELCIYVTIMYFPFVIAEILHLSGIVAVLFTGIAAKRYAEPNLSAITSQNADTVFRLVAHLTETIIFLELGMAVFGVGIEAFHPAFIFLSLWACLVGRAANIYPITFFFNACVGNRDSPATIAATETIVVNDDAVATPENNDTLTEISKPIDDTKIPWTKANMMWFSGLRGAVSYALARTFPKTGNEQIFIATTMVIVLVTTFIFGGSTEWALQKLDIPMDVDETTYLKSLRKKRLLCFGWLHRFERTTLRSWVIRDYQKEKSGDTTTEDEAGDSDYYEHIELTEQEHIEIVTHNKNSIYDFGQ